MKRDDSSPQAYRNDVDGELSEMLEEIRSLILQTAQGVDEEIEYGMLNFPGIANLAAQKHYVAMYVNPEVLADFKTRYDLDCGKSCLRFRRPTDVDREMIIELVEALRDRDLPT